MKSLLFLLLFISTTGVQSQTTPNNGVETSRPTSFALKNATIFVSPEKKITNSTILIKDDKIISVGKVVSIPKDAVVIDCEGKIILPAFIELSTNVGIPASKKKPYSSNIQYNTSKEGAYYWNEAIHPEVDANQTYHFDDKINESLINMGFGFALTHKQSGISRGKGAFVSLENNSKSLIKTAVSTSFFS